MSALRSARGLLTTTSRTLAQRSSSSSVLARSALSAVARVRPVIANVWTVSSARQFSVSRSVHGEGTTDMALVQKLSEELQYEREAATAQSGTPDFIQEFKSQGVWTINDTPSADEVTFERTFGNEHIRIMFSIADLDANPEHEFDPDALEEGEEPPEPQPHTVTSTPIRVAISITKRDAPGALSVDSLCQDGAFLIENASFYQDKEVGTALTAEADWKRRGLYLGPTFENLDAGVQDEFEKYLDERGINESMALFIPDYAEYKEQTEYVRWLESIKKFVEA